jgi:hypothetical protein
MNKYLLGPTEPGLFTASVFFAAVGILFVLLLGTTLRVKHSKSSPEKWSWSYLLSDNAKRIYAGVIATLLSLRFMPELFGWELTVWKALCVGMAWDTILLIIKQKTSIFDPKKPE